MAINVDSTFPYLSRRGFILAGGAALTAVSAFPADPACTLFTEQEEGPYYVDDETLRSNVTEGKLGVPIQLAVMLVDSRTCKPLSDAALDIWHCDATGVYSGFTAMNPDGPPGGGPGGPGGPGRRGPGGPGGPPPDFAGGPGGPPPGSFGRGGFGPGGPGGRGERKIDPTRFLRGVQLTDAKGRAEFSTIYPGWYSGRAIHIHVKAHVGGSAAAKYSGGHVAHTGQFFFPEDLTERVARLEPYAKRLAVHRTTQEEDDIFQHQHGAEGMLRMERLGKTDAEGFRATITVAINPEAIPEPVQGGPGRGRSGPPPGRA
jgi:protocatechuate 3,4-dioxygenase beta subunit